jgi:tetratricopeptide (TPR) repeat protein
MEVKLGLDHPDTLRTRGNLAYAYHAAGHITEADQLDERIRNLLTAALQWDPQDTIRRWQRGDWYARNGRWQQAADDYRLVLQHQPADALEWLHAAPALAASDLDAYRHSRRTMLHRFGTTQDPPTAEYVAKACLLLPDNGADIEAACQLAERAVVLGKDHDFKLYFAICKGLADYRRNKARAASAVLEPLVPRSVSVPHLAALNHLVLALALHRQGDSQAAHKHLAEGAKLLKQRVIDLPDFKMAASQYSHDWAIAWLLHGEAQKSLAEKKAKAKDR